MRLRFLQSNADLAYVLLRVVAGALFAFHGAQKMFGIYGGFRPHFPAQIWFGGVIELVGGLAIALGLCTRCAAFVASGMMAVAYFQFHWKLALGAQFFPAVNKGELAVLYCFIFLYVACRGVGKFGVDALSRK
jgi:putative oxidoreductase